MTNPVEAGEKGEQRAPASAASDAPEAVARTDRRLPFVLRVATEWSFASDLPSSEDGQLRFWRRAPLTGELATTSHGEDVSFSDMEVR